MLERVHLRWLALLEKLLRQPAAMSRPMNTLARHMMAVYMCTIRKGTCSSCAYRGVVTDAALKVDAADEQVNAGVVPMPPRDAQLDAVN